MLMTDGTAEISAQAWGPLGITLNTQINVGHTKKIFRFIKQIFRISVRQNL